jgi:hypothetical protein
MLSMSVVITSVPAIRIESSARTQPSPFGGAAGWG